MRQHPLAILLLACFVLTACSRNSRLTVINQSTATLKNVTASGPGFSVSLGTLAPGAEKGVSIGPRGEWDVTLAFDANEQRFAPGKQGYFEDRRKVTATVAADFSVRVSD